MADEGGRHICLYANSLAIYSLGLLSCRNKLLYSTCLDVSAVLSLFPHPVTFDSVSHFQSHLTEQGLSEKSSYQLYEQRNLRKRETLPVSQQENAAMEFSCHQHWITGVCPPCLTPNPHESKLYWFHCRKKYPLAWRAAQVQHSEI